MGQQSKGPAAFGSEICDSAVTEREAVDESLMATAAWLHQSARPCSEDTIFTHTHIYIYVYIEIDIIFPWIYWYLGFLHLE